MEKTLKKAIEGGYNIRAEHKLMFEGTISKMLLDPLFWQALGKACGWTHKMIPTAFVEFEDGDDEDTMLDWDSTEGWKFYWHRFIDHLAEGKDVESFFNDLIK